MRSKRTKHTKWDAVPPLSDGVVKHIHDFVDVPGLKRWAHCGRSAFSDCYKKMAKFPTEALRNHIVHIQCRGLPDGASADVMPIHVHAMVHRICAICGGPWQGRLHWPWLIPAHPSCFDPLLVDMSKVKYIPIEFVRQNLMMHGDHAVARPHRAIQEKHTLSYFEDKFKCEIEAHRREFEMQAYNLHKEYRDSVVRDRNDRSAAYAAGREARIANQKQFVAAFPGTSKWSEVTFPSCITSVVESDVALAIEYAEIYREYTEAGVDEYWPWWCVMQENAPAVQVRATMDAVIQHPDAAEQLRRYRSYANMLTAEHVYNFQAMLTVLPAIGCKTADVATANAWSAETRVKIVALKDTFPKKVWRAVLGAPTQSDDLNVLLDALVAHPEVVRDLAKSDDIGRLCLARVTDLAYMRQIFPAEDDSRVRLNASQYACYTNRFRCIMEDCVARKSTEFMRELAGDTQFMTKYTNACRVSCCEPITAWGRDRIHDLPLCYHGIAKIGEFLAAGI
ncbi:hypothetical protein JKP88DRAFT_243936 [Tribonema minus]|uniref:Uncharacterized protein n=1 Tax=Tribonema minus TaxID=303371 RepID=A0A835ZEF5_9STRA|nr:hypothetical protein JKP88DRAFT_243936 [Tribonema minus]